MTQGRHEQGAIDRARDDRCSAFDASGSQVSFFFGFFFTLLMFLYLQIATRVLAPTDESHVSSPSTSKCFFLFFTYLYPLPRALQMHLESLVQTTVYSCLGQQGREMRLGINGGGARDSSQSHLEPQVCFYYCYSLLLCIPHIRIVLIYLGCLICFK